MKKNAQLSNNYNFSEFLNNILVLLLWDIYWLWNVCDVNKHFTESKTQEAKPRNSSEPGAMAFFPQRSSTPTSLVLDKVTHFQIHLSEQDEWISCLNIRKETKYCSTSRQSSKGCGSIEVRGLQGKFLSCITSYLKDKHIQMVLRRHIRKEKFQCLNNSDFQTETYTFLCALMLSAIAWRITSYYIQMITCFNA